MAENEIPDKKQASRQATEWMILLKDDPDDAAVNTAFEVWLSTHPVNKAAWQDMQRASEAMDQAVPVYADKWQPMLADMRREKGKIPSVSTPVSQNARPEALRFASHHGARRIRRRQVLAFGAVAAAACLMLAVVGPDLLQNLRSDYATGTAETRTVRLADDSMVTLAPESAISVTYTPGDRQIQLLAGEAYFDVSPNPGRPFQVGVEAVTVTVLGTAFDVRRGVNETDIAVSQGVVRVDAGAVDPPVTETLTVGQAVRVNASGHARRSDGPVQQVAAWRQNQLIARDEPLGIVVDQLRRYYTGKIIVTDDALAAQSVTGVYNLADPVEALRGIARAQNAVVRRITPWLIVVSRS
ncbi:MAG: FecR domain-containing protein [Alphaproteobacteria bacterium]|nr:FecR domain-containing protein [Alphaproteobacteria bacterium]